MLKIQKVLLQSLVPCLLSDENESRTSSNTQICKISSVFFQIQASSDLVSLNSNASIYVISQKKKPFFQYADSLYVVINLKKFGGQMDMW